MNNKMLPIGSVIKLKNNDKPYMIISYYSLEINGKKNKYTIVPFPEGYLGLISEMFINDNDIEDIIFVGYINDNTKSFLKNIERVDNNE